MALKRLTKAQTLVKYQPSDAYRLRDEAHWAFMDGRTATAKEYNRRAAILETEARELQRLTRFGESVLDSVRKDLGRAEESANG